MSQRTLAQVIGGMPVAIGIIELHIIWIHLLYPEKTIGVVVAAGLMILRIS